MTPLAASTRLVDALAARLARERGAAVERVETHLSWLLLVGADAYKLKKPLRTDFVDFGTLALRRAACEEELRLNRRTAAQLYLGVLPVTGRADAPRLGGPGAALEYALHMRRFPADAVFDARIARGEPSAAQVQALAQAIADLHARAAVAGGGHAAPAALRQAAADNLAALTGAGALPGAPPGCAARVAALREWTAREGARHAPLMHARLTDGWVREGHGDLHLGNLLWLDGAPLLFDALEFNPALRWIDVLADLAFLFMDLYAHQRADAAWRLLDGWLQAVGGHEGLPLLPYHATYRAGVRAKVAALRAGQCGGAGQAAAVADLARYLALAERLAGLAPPLAGAPPLQRARPALWLTVGVSGAGKSWLGAEWVARRGGVRLRADVERKRLHGLAPLADSRAAGLSLYTAAASARTFERLLALARTLLTAGFEVLVDATFIQRARRAPFRALAAELGLPCHLLALHAPDAVLRQRVRQRRAEGRDASEADEAVLQGQLRGFEPLDAAEQAQAIAIDSTQPVDWPRLLARA